MSNSSRVAELAGVQVLVVDDDPDSLDMMQAALLYGGARVTGAPSAMKAIEALGRVTPNGMATDPDRQEKLKRALQQMRRDVRQQLAARAQKRAAEERAAREPRAPALTHWNGHIRPR